MNGTRTLESARNFKPKSSSPHPRPGNSVLSPTPQWLRLMFEAGDRQPSRSFSTPKHTFVVVLVNWDKPRDLSIVLDPRTRGRTETTLSHTRVISFGPPKTITAPPTSSTTDNGFLISSYKTWHMNCLENMNRFSVIIFLRTIQSEDWNENWQMCSSRIHWVVRERGRLPSELCVQTASIARSHRHRGWLTIDRPSRNHAVNHYYCREGRIGRDARVRSHRHCRKPNSDETIKRRWTKTSDS